MSSEIIAALLGAVAAGLLQTIVTITQRRHEAEATLVAIASEVAAICGGFDRHLIRQHVSAQMAAIRAGAWDGRGVIIDSEQNYFTVFEANASNLGKLRREDAAMIVAFYYDCKSLLDTTRPGGRLAQSQDRDFVAANLEVCERMMAELFVLGARIARRPKIDLPTPWIHEN